MSLIIFDFHGPLCSFNYSHIYRAFTEIATKLNAKMPWRDSLNAFKKWHQDNYGNNYKLMGIPEEKHNLAEQIFSEAINRDNFIIPEIHSLLTTLKNNNHTLAIVSFCNEKIILQKLGNLANLFCSIVGFETLLEYPKPQKANALKKVLELFNSDNLISYYVTDAVIDIEPAKTAKVDHVVGITWGVCNKAEFQQQGIKLVFNSPLEILQL